VPRGLAVRCWISNWARAANCPAFACSCGYPMDRAYPSPPKATSATRQMRN